MSYDKVLINQGTPILYTELNELQDIVVSNFQDYVNLIKGATKGVQDLTYTLASNSITVTGAKVFAVGKVFTLPSTTVSSLFATTSSATGSLYAKITDSVVTGSTDPSIVNNNIGPTASRIKYNIALAFTTGTIPADITGQAPGSNTWYVPMLSLTGTSTTVPTSDETVYPFTKLNDAQTLGGKSLSGIENDISNARSGGASDAEAWVKGYGLGSSNVNLATGTDLNTLSNTGFYSVSQPANGPTTGNWTWDIIHMKNPNANYFTQIASRQSGDNSIYLRTNTGGAWSAWAQLATTALGTTSKAGLTQLVDSITSTDTTKSATANSVKMGIDWVKSYGLGTYSNALATSTDLNTVQTNGFYYATNASNLNFPVTANGYLLVQAHNSTYVSQIFISVLDGTIYARANINGTWGAWNQVIQSTRKVTAGTGLTGGGDLSTDRTISLDTTYLGSTSRPGLLQLTDSTSSTSTTTGATPNSVKTVNDSLTSHTGNTSNPHSVTTQQVNKVTADSFGATAGPANFPIGISVMEVTTATGYPTATGTLITNFLTTDRGFQMFVDKATEVMSIRVADSSQTNGWGAWKTIVSTSLTASTSQAGIVQLTDSVSSTSTTTGATPNSVSTVNNSLTSHTGNTNNPHSTTASQVGAPPTARKVTAGTGLTGGGDLSADRTISLDTTYLGSTSRPGLLQLVDSTTSTDTTKSATANSVKMALDWVKSYGLGSASDLLAGGTDLNTVITTGFYRVNAGVNVPPRVPNDNASIWHYVLVQDHDNTWISQMAIEYNTGTMFVRTSQGGTSATWGAWQQLATTALGTTSAPGLTQLVDSTTSTDTTKSATANSVKMALDWVKSYGLGTSGKTVTDCNAISENGLYTGVNIANAPTTSTSDYYSIIHNQWDATTINQLAIIANGNSAWTRTKAGGTWGAWRQLAYADTAQMVKFTNDSGYALANSQADMNSFTTTGVWYVGSAVTTNLPVTGGYSDTAIVRVSNPSANAVIQEFIYYAGNQAKAVRYARTYWRPTNTWGSWDRVTTSNADFGNSLQGNGYQKLPNGLIIQWGRASAVPNASMTSYPLPIAFPNNLLQATATIFNADGRSVWNYVSASQIGLYQDSGASAQMSYIAIGY